MVRASLAAAVVRPTRNGTLVPTPVAGDAVNNNEVTNTGRTLLWVENVSVDTARILTIEFVETVLGQTVDPIDESLAFGTTQLFGPYPVAQFGRLLRINPAHADLTFIVIQP